MTDLTVLKRGSLGETCVCVSCGVLSGVSEDLDSNILPMTQSVETLNSPGDRWGILGSCQEEPETESVVRSPLE